MKVCRKTNKSKFFFTCTTGHLSSPFVPAVGHLPVCFKKILMPGSRPGVGVGGGALLEMTDALVDHKLRSMVVQKDNEVTRKAFLSLQVACPHDLKKTFLGTGIDSFTH